MMGCGFSTTNIDYEEAAKAKLIMIRKQENQRNDFEKTINKLSGMKNGNNNEYHGRKNSCKVSNEDIHVDIYKLRNNSIYG